MNATRMNLPGMALALGVGLVLASPVSAQEAKDRPAEAASTAESDRAALVEMAPARGYLAAHADVQEPWRSRPTGLG